MEKITAYTYYFNMNDLLREPANDLYDAMREHLGPHVKYHGDWSPMQKQTLNRIGKLPINGIYSNKSYT